MRIDIHTHSWVSDGTESPADVIKQGHAAGLDVISLTDHDAVEGWDAARSAALEMEIGWLGGIEVSCRVPDTGVTVHMLAYMPDPEDAALVAAMEEQRNSRMARARMIVEKLAEDFPITWEDVLAQTSDGATIGRPHIADALVAANIIPDRSSAFSDLLSSKSRYYVDQPAPSPVRAVEMIRAAGGVPVMAHPAAPARGRVIRAADLEECVDAGLAGVEIHHRDNNQAGREWLHKVARERNLIVTGSSDYHGTGKPNRLGENLTEPEQLQKILNQAAPANRSAYTAGLPAEWVR
ncbi:PHP domain-containing protein [Arthrobacter sp. HMSC08H08]|uniref:PHP domain-containing protein n=1 Tax=Arthrobacter sp. HMSC08H08 TaxID=1581143 RepID=UPI0008A61270|nr:PHP domain-containing protein [Arthrobacter sp. HMSC08H08]OFT22910.1 phosphatase [Arthrobacter sp. HMSC08H08]